MPQQFFEDIIPLFYFLFHIIQHLFVKQYVHIYNWLPQHIFILKFPLAFQQEGIFNYYF
jgi:hypothetical protein